MESRPLYSLILRSSIRGPGGFAARGIPAVVCSFGFLYLIHKAAPEKLSTFISRFWKGSVIVDSLVPKKTLSAFLNSTCRLLAPTVPWLANVSVSLKPKGSMQDMQDGYPLSKLTEFSPENSTLESIYQELLKSNLFRAFCEQENLHSLPSLADLATSSCLLAKRELQSRSQQKKELNFEILSGGCLVFIDASNIWYGTSNVKVAQHHRDVFCWTDRTLSVRIFWRKLLSFTLGPLNSSSEVSVFGSIPATGQAQKPGLAPNWLSREGLNRVQKDSNGERLIDGTELKPEELSEEARKMFDRVYIFDVFSDGKWIKQKMNWHYRPRDKAEKGVDSSLVIEAMKSLYSQRYRKFPTVFYSGDADMLPLYEHLCSNEVDVIVFYWKDTVSHAVKRFRHKRFQCFPLDPFEFQICCVYPLHPMVGFKWELESMLNPNLPEATIMNEISKSVGDRVGYFFSWSQKPCGAILHYRGGFEQEDLADRILKLKQGLSRLMRPGYEISQFQDITRTPKEDSQEDAVPIPLEDLDPIQEQSFPKMTESGEEWAADCSDEANDDNEASFESSVETE